MQKYLDAARSAYVDDSDGDIAIDDDAQFSPIEGGVWVQAWVWVSNEDVADD